MRGVEEEGGVGEGGAVGLTGGATGGDVHDAASVRTEEGGSGWLDIDSDWGGRDWGFYTEVSDFNGFDSNGTHNKRM
jgi:hypothetical protein